MVSADITDFQSRGLAHHLLVLAAVSPDVISYLGLVICRR
jgi:hypothetical protein